jgi:hypothetical protein
MISPPEQLLAIVSDKPVEAKVPQFSREQITEIADLIEGRYLTDAENCLDLYVDNQYVPLDKTGGNLLLRTLVAVVSGLKGNGPLNRLAIFMRRKP